MARTLKVLILAILLGGLLAGCGTAPVAGRSAGPEQKLASVLERQQQGEAAYHAGDMPRALALFQQLTKDYPDEAGYWYMLGNIYVRTQQPDLAVQAYTQTIARDPSHARAWHNLGVVRMRQAEAAFVSSAGTAKADDPMRQVSSHLADELARIGSSGGESAKPAPVAPPSAGAVIDDSAAVQTNALPPVAKARQSPLPKAANP